MASLPALCDDYLPRLLASSRDARTYCSLPMGTAWYSVTLDKGILGDSMSLLWCSDSCHLEGKSFSPRILDSTRMGGDRVKGSACSQLGVLKGSPHPVPRERLSSTSPWTGVGP